MYHNRARMLKLEYWLRRVIWLALFGLLMTLIFSVVSSISSLLGPDFSAGMPDSYGNTMIPLRQAFIGLRMLAYSASNCLILVGLDKFIRYLLALEQGLSSRRPNATRS